MPVIGVDLGGTRIRAGMVEAGGAVVCLREMATRAERPACEIAADIAALVRAVEADVRTVGTGAAAPIGVGVPTTIGPDGALAPSPNLPTCAGYPLARELGNLLGRPVVLENDARCFALGEVLAGAARGALIAAGVTLGTSIGLGMVVNGALLRGAHGEAGEIWRSPVDLLAAPGAETAGRADSLHDLLGGHALGTDAATTARLARCGDAAALAVFARYGERLGAALCWLCDMLDPDVIVIGGAIAASFDLFADHARAVLGARRTLLAASALGDRAAILGAAGVAGWREGNRA